MASLKPPAINGRVLSIVDARSDRIILEDDENGTVIVFYARMVESTQVPYIEVESVTR